ncbi:MAG: 4-(cytidine 5'-diphospho)-2-C-methyl-D-erythritol kinase [Phycisphaerales bacterium]|nr:MAG: 4-(cytidine 5'-diphospho)-2-C-methyl-D-erythritol kinase [Phycisphaerales bacterium]
MVWKEQIVADGGGLLVRAPAKINLSLLVAGKRPDGFHELETLMAKVNFYDEVLIQPGLKRGIELVCRGRHWAPPGRENLVYRAAELLLDRCGAARAIRVTLTKNIRAGSGLGSASSDAAATLIGLNRYMELGLEDRALAEMGAELGSDVAFFLNGPLAFCTGRGEKIWEVREKFDFVALLILPDVSISTAKVYANYKHDEALYRALSGEINSHVLKNRIDLVTKMCVNALQRSCFGLAKGLAELKAGVESSGIGPLCLSGSGSAMFCVLDSLDRERAQQYKERLEATTDCESVIVSNNRW